jgi:nicotinamidase-related amidase
MPHANTLRSEQSALLLIDIQEAFRPSMEDFAQVATRIGSIVRGAQLLGVPILITEQVPTKLGRTAPEILDAFAQPPRIFDKTCFSSCGAAGQMDQLAATQRKQIVICGLETHVCVNQTAHDLLAAGYQVHLLHDCVMSRKTIDHQAGLAKMAHSGVVPCSAEIALFEWMGDATHEQFRAVQRLVK